MWKTCNVAAVLLFLSQTACGEYIRIIGQTWVVESGTSCSVTLAIENTGPSGILLSSWQLSLQIVPVEDSPETACFANLADYTPADYVFGNQSLGISQSCASQTVSTFMDFSTAPGGGAYIQSGVNILQFDITSPTAEGVYDIILMPNTDPDVGSYWLDGDLVVHIFEIVPPAERSSDVVATVVFSAIPEPPSGITLGSALVLALLVVIVRGRRSPRGLLKKRPAVLGQ